METKGATTMAVTEDSVGGVSPTVIAGDSLIGDRCCAIRQARIGAEVAAAVSNVGLGDIRGYEAGSQCHEPQFKFNSRFHFAVGYWPGIAFQIQFVFLRMR